MIAINIDGKIKTYSKVPETWRVDGKDISPFHLQSEEVIRNYGFRKPVAPTDLLPTQKLGGLYEDENGEILYRIIDKSVQELEQETANAKEQEKEKIKEAKIKAYVESVLTPSERLSYYPEWKQQAYKAGEKVTYKLKTFENTIEGNTNAPDKGGWIEIK